jgi:2-methylcitrate dehydratase PrpD
LLAQRATRLFFEETGLKPYPIARQALAAVEACRQIAGRNTKAISRITVDVPSAQARVIDQPAWPTNRMQSIASVQYQLALSLLSPDHLSDLDRTPPFETKPLRELAAKIRVRVDAQLESYYPQAWPARVVVEQSGKRISALVRVPRGDAQNPLQWEGVLLKAGAVAPILTAIRTADPEEAIPGVVLHARE